MALTPAALQTNLWQSRAAMPTPRSYAASGVVGKVMYVVGEIVGYSGTMTGDNRECVAHAVKWVLK